VVFVAGINKYHHRENICKNIKIKAIADQAGYTPE
jgi:hypothetical protein